jgi:putative DNA primase/helicase
MNIPANAKHGDFLAAQPGRWATKTIKVNGSQQRFIVLTDQSEDE